MLNESSRLLSEKTHQQPRVLETEARSVVIVDEGPPPIRATARKKRPEPLDRIEHKQRKSVIKLLDADKLKKQDRIAKKKDDWSRGEAEVLRSTRITESMKNLVNARIRAAFEAGRTRVPLIAFRILEGEVDFVGSFDEMSDIYEIEYLGQPKSIKRSQLSADLFDHEKAYKTIISVPLYLDGLKPPLAHIITKQRLALTPKPYELFISEPTEENMQQQEEEIVTTTTTTITTTTMTITQKNIKSMSSGNTASSLSSDVIINGGLNKKPGTSGSGSNSSSSLSRDMSTISDPALPFIDRLALNLTRQRCICDYYLVVVDLALTTPCSVLSK